MQQGFDAEGARKAGYGDAEILSHLTSSRSFDVDGARNAGYSDAEIISHLSQRPARVQHGASGTWEEGPSTLDCTSSEHFGQKCHFSKRRFSSYTTPVLRFSVLR